MNYSLIFLIVAFASHCDSKPDLETGAYKVRSDCAGADSDGEVEIKEKSPNILLAEGASSFGFPSNELRKHFNQRLVSSGEQRECTSHLSGDYSDELLFACHELAGRTLECTIALELK